MSEENSNHNPINAMIDAIKEMSNVTHAIMIVALENGATEIRGLDLPDWMIKGLLNEALDAMRMFDVATHFEKDKNETVVS